MADPLEPARRAFEAAPHDPELRQAYAARLVDRFQDARDAAAYAALEALAARFGEDPEVAEHLAAAMLCGFQHAAWEDDDQSVPSAPAQFEAALRWRSRLVRLGRDRDLPYVHARLADLLRLAVENRASAETVTRAATDLAALLRSTAPGAGPLEPAHDPVTYLDALEAHARAHADVELTITLHEAVAALFFHWAEARRSSRLRALLDRLRRDHRARPSDEHRLELLATALSAWGREALAGALPDDARAADDAKAELCELHAATGAPFVAVCLAELIVDAPPSPDRLAELRALCATHPGDAGLLTLLGFARDERR